MSWIEARDLKETNLANFLQANIKLESYGLSIADAGKALELDPDNIKVRLSSLRAFGSGQY